MSLGEKIRHLREEHNMTQDDLSHLLNIPKSNISKYENDRSNPGGDAIKKIAETFGVSLDYLLDAAIDETDHLIEKLAVKTESGPLQWNDFVLDKTYSILSPSLENALRNFLSKTGIDDIFRLYEIYYTLHEKDAYFLLIHRNISYFVFGEYGSNQDPFDTPAVFFVSSREKNFTKLIQIATKKKLDYQRNKTNQMIKHLNSL